MAFLIILFTFLGRFIDSSTVPNQQIVVQFSHTEVTEIHVQKAIEDIQYKLQNIGVENLLIGQDENGHLKITYYSTANVESIESILSENSEFKVAFESHNDNSNKDSDPKNSKDYKLNVSEIQKSNNSNDWDFDSVQIVEHNHKSDRFNNLKHNASGYLFNSNTLNQLVKVAMSDLRIQSIPSHNTYNIPEVRAGPKC